MPLRKNGVLRYKSVFGIPLILGKGIVGNQSRNVQFYLNLEPINNEQKKRKDRTISDSAFSHPEKSFKVFKVRLSHSHGSRPNPSDSMTCISYICNTHHWSIITTTNMKLSHFLCVLCHPY